MNTCMEGMAPALVLSLHQTSLKAGLSLIVQAPGEEAGSFVHLSLSLENMAHLKMKFGARKGP